MRVSAAPPGAPETDDGGPVASPCVNVCRLDEAGICIGCLRTAAEVAAWPAMDPGGQRRLLARLDERRRQGGLPVNSFQEIE